jgi:hypothetical protein
VIVIAGAAYNRKSAKQIYNNYADILTRTLCTRIGKTSLKHIIDKGKHKRYLTDEVIDGKLSKRINDLTYIYGIFLLGKSQGKIYIAV